MLILSQIAIQIHISFAVQDADSKFTKSISDLMKVWIKNVTDPLMNYKPWRRSEISQAHKNIRFLRDYGKRVSTHNLSLMIDFVARYDFCLLVSTAQEIISRRKAALRNGAKDFEDDILSMMLEYQEENADYTIAEQVDDFLTLFIAGEYFSAPQLWGNRSRCIPSRNIPSIRQETIKRSIPRTRNNSDKSDVNVDVPRSVPRVEKTRLPGSRGCPRLKRQRRLFRPQLARRRDQLLERVSETRPSGSHHRRPDRRRFRHPLRQHVG